MLVERGRLRLEDSLADWLARAASPRTVRLLQLSPAIACEVAGLPDSFHRDPADRIIVATSRVFHLHLLSYDLWNRRSQLVTLAP
jgi:PIN domain nuclease of toxin-antitoxin system